MGAAMDEADDRLFAIDLMRGAALLGGLAMLAHAIGAPAIEWLHPSLANASVAAKASWLTAFVLLDGKVAALFAMLFGLSTLLVIDKAELDGADGFALLRRRLLWLLPFGLASLVLLWPGDRLVLLALAGMVLTRMLAKEPIDLIKWAIGLYAVQWVILIVAATLAAPHGVGVAYTDGLARTMVHDVAMNRGSYGDLLAARTTGSAMALGRHILLNLPATTAFLLLGAAMAKGGFFAGQWQPGAYRGTAMRALAVGGVPLLGIGIWSLVRGVDPLSATLVQTVAFPFILPMAVGLAALLMITPRTRLTSAVAAAGRLALTNGVVALILFCALFQGFGWGLYGRLDSIGLTSLAALTGIATLIWSPLWLRFAGQGPAERLWRKLYS